MDHLTDPGTGFGRTGEQPARPRTRARRAVAARPADLLVEG